MRLLLIAVAAVALTGCAEYGSCGDYHDPGPKETTLPLTYQRSYGGVAGGTAKLRIRLDGVATLHGGTTGGSCATDDNVFRVSRADLARVEGLLEDAHEIEPRVVDEPATEAPSFGLEASGVRLRYSGYDVVPEAAEALFAALDDIVTEHCAMVTP
jgi:hypothetical protein